MYLNQKENPGVVSRLTRRTPRFFRKVRRFGLALLAISGAIAAAPIAVPAIIATAAGYIATAGAVSVAVSQLAVEPE